MSGDFAQDAQYYRERFNTELSPEEEFKFHDWADQVGNAQGRNVLDDLEDYDLRGAWKEGAQAAGNGHLPDTYKKPNHPTFSDESKYHGAEAPDGSKYEGGHWDEMDGKTTYTPSRRMLEKSHPVDWLRGYMNEREPDVQLVLPKEE